MKLEELLKLKKFEKPSEAQWERFDEELKNKMLLRIVNESRGGRFRWFRLSALSASACLLFAIGFLASQFCGMPEQADGWTDIPQVAAIPDVSQSKFVKNEILTKAFENPASIAVAEDETNLQKTNYIATTPEYIQGRGF